MCLAHPTFSGGSVSELHAASAPRPGTLWVGGQPVFAQPGRPLRGAAVHRPHRLPSAQGWRHLLPGQEVCEVEVSISGSQCQCHWWVCGRGGQKLQGSGAAGLDRLPEGQESVHKVYYLLSGIIQQSLPNTFTTHHLISESTNNDLCMLRSQNHCRVLHKAPVVKGESLPQCDRDQPRSPTPAQCSDRRRTTFAEGSGTSAGCPGLWPLHQSPDLTTGASTSPSQVCIPWQCFPHMSRTHTLWCVPCLRVFFYPLLSGFYG